MTQRRPTATPPPDGDPPPPSERPAPEVVSIRRRVGIGPPREPIAVGLSGGQGAPIKPTIRPSTAATPASRPLTAPVDPRRERTPGAILAPLGLRGPAYLHALQAAAGDQARVASIWLEVGDALIALGRVEKARLAWFEGLTASEGQGGRGMAASFYWRLARVCEARRELDGAAGWYDKAASAFLRDGAKADEAVARMAVARVTLWLSGAGLARQLARDAVTTARESEDRLLFAQAVELSGEVAFELGVLDEAIASLRDALRLYEELGERMALTRTAIALADALLEAGQSLAAIAALEQAVPFIESHESLEVRGRGMGLLGLVNLDVGDIAGATEPLEKAHVWLDAANAPLRRARLLVATARRVQSRAGAAEALPLYERAWTLAQLGEGGERYRQAPIAYALARCVFDVGDFIRADDVIGTAIDLVQEAGDLEGLSRCTELAVRIAARLQAGRIALDRLLTLARAQARLGEGARALKTLKHALAATMNLPDGDVGLVSEELMEIVRQRGIASLGPAEAMETAGLLVAAQRPTYAAELAVLDAERQLSNDRRADAARTLAQAAFWVATAHHERSSASARAEALALWDRAIELADEVGLPERDAWVTERTITAES